jgi:hypothetical protein
VTARILKTAQEVLSWFEDQQAENEMEREIKIRQGKASIRRHIRNQQKTMDRLWKLGKKALSLGDDAQFRRIGKLYLQAQEDISRWERYLLTFETLEARRDQAKATTNFLEAMKALNESLMETTSPQAMAQMQQDLAEGLARAETLEDRMAVMLELTDEALLGDEALSETDLSDLREMMGAEVVQEEADAFDARIEEGLRKIREEMEKNN